MPSATSASNLNHQPASETCPLAAGWHAVTPPNRAPLLRTTLPGGERHADVDDHAPTRPGGVPDCSHG